MAGGTSGKTTHFVRFGVVNPHAIGRVIKIVDLWMGGARSDDGLG